VFLYLKKELGARAFISFCVLVKATALWEIKAREVPIELPCRMLFHSLKLLDEEILREVLDGG